MEQHILAWITEYGYAAIIGLLMLGIVGLPVPDETLLTFTGYLVFRGTFRLPTRTRCGSPCRRLSGRPTAIRPRPKL